MRILGKSNESCTEPTLEVRGQRPSINEHVHTRTITHECVCCEILA